MARLGRFGRELRARLWRAGVAEEVDAELGFHVEALARELERRGVERQEARRRARARFGDLEDVKAHCREIRGEGRRRMRRTEWASEAWQDVRFAVRQLTRTPLSTAVAGLTLALGIGAATVIFSAVRAVVLRPLAFERPDEVAMLLEQWQGRDGDVAPGLLADWREESRSFAAIAEEQLRSFNLGSGGEPLRVRGGAVGSDFFRVFGVPAARGRTFAPGPGDPLERRTVVLSHGLWSDRFGGDPALLGRPIRLGGRAYTVIGVMPADFDPSLSGERLWVIREPRENERANYDEHYLNVFGRLALGVPLERAAAEIETITRRVYSARGEELEARESRVVPLTEVLVGDAGPRLWLLLGAVGFVLLIACVNVTNLLLARGAGRGRELAIRAALGAGRGRIVRLLLTESTVLAAGAALAGVALAGLGIEALAGLAPADIPRLDQTRIDGPVLLFAVGVAVASGLAVGWLPALRATAVDLQSRLREGGRGRGAVRDRTRRWLVTGEVALAMVLLGAAGLLVRSSILLGRVDPGFATEDVFAARIAVPPERVSDPAELERTFVRLAERVRRAPGVTAAGATSQAPLGGGGTSNGLLREGLEPTPENLVDARSRVITAGYLETLGVPLVAGRRFTPADGDGGELVMIVNEALARALWPGEDPVGKRVACCEADPERRWKRVVGVVADMRWRGPAVDPPPEFFLPIEQAPERHWTWTRSAMSVVARGEIGAGGLAGAVREAAAEVLPGLPLYAETSMEAALRSSTAAARFNTLLLALLGAIGLVLAAGGIYAVISWLVTQRTHEIGVRMALGADGRDIVALMARQGAWPLAIGVAVGAVGALAAGRLLRSWLFGVEPGDPLTLGAVAVTLVAVGMAASLVPAWRAARVDPTRSLDAS